jgi:hypothetical protein
MRGPDGERADAVAAAAIDALLAARWQCTDLLSRKSPDAARELLLGHAAELASSAVGRDQLLSKALEAAAADLSAGRSPLGEGASFFFREREPCATARRIVRQQVFRGGGVPSRKAHAVVADLERRLRSECADDQALRKRLAAEAHLHERLWDDPRLPADAKTRLIMLCAVPKAMARSQDLDPSHARFIRRRDAPRRRRARALALPSPRSATAAPQGHGRAPIRSRIPGWLWALGLLVAGAGWILLDA